MVEEKRIPDGYKNTEVGIIPNDWDVINLGESSLIKARIGWQGLTVKEYRKNGDYYLITGTDFFNNKIKWNKCCFIDKKRYEQDRNIQLRNDDLLITKDGTIGKIAYIDRLNKPATLNSGIFLVRSKEHIYEPVFLYHILRSFYFIKFLNQLSAGSTINHLYQKDIIKYNFILPKKEEQQAISIVLSDTDNLILSLEKLIDKKELIKRGVMQELLTGEKRLDGFNSKWNEDNLGELFDITAGGDLASEYYSSHRNEKYKYEIYSNTINNFGIYGFTSKPRHEKNTITVTARGTIGYAISRSEEYDAIGRLLVLKPKKRLDCYFISQYINQMINFTVESTGVPQLTAPQISKYIITYPEYKEQKAIANILLDMDKEIEALQKKLDKYKKIKEGMMEELLTGKRRLV